MRLPPPAALLAAFGLPPAPLPHAARLSPPTLSLEHFEAYYAQQALVPPHELPALLKALRTPLPLDVRVSARAPLASRALERLEALAGPSAPLEWVHSGGAAHQWRAPADRQWQPFVHQQQLRGALTRQEAASMLPALLLAPAAGMAVLDMCAAPGSKACHLLELMEAAEAEAAAAPGDKGAKGGFVVANDGSLDRAISLTHRLTSVNVASPHCVVTSMDGRWWPSLRGLAFDRILVDAPCSGDGTLRKKTKSTPTWDAAAGEALHPKQLRLLLRGLALLRPGGLLVYSTCSFNPIENEAVVAAALRSCRKRSEPIELLDPRSLAPLDGLDLASGLRTWAAPAPAPASEPQSGRAAASMAPPSAEEEAWLGPLLGSCVRLLPHREDTGGFFIAAFRRGEADAAVGDAVAAGGAAAADGASVDGASPEPAAAAAGSFGGRGGDASGLVALDPTSDEWASISAFYGLRGTLGGALLWQPGRARLREKLYLASHGAAAMLREHWQPSGAAGKQLRGRLHAMGAKAFERLKLTRAANYRDAAAFGCDWRLCQQALPWLLPALTRRVLSVADEATFASTLRERGLPMPAIRSLAASGALAGVESCSAAGGELEPGGVVLSLTEFGGEGGGGGEGGEGEGVGEAKVLASVVGVLSPGGLEVWAPKEEVRGLLELLPASA